MTTSPRSHVAPAPEVDLSSGPEPEPEPSLAERYAHMSQSALRPRAVDVLLRALDVVIAGLALILLAPVALIIAAAVLAASRRPILYRGARVGRGGRTFTMFKFRTLMPGAEDRLGLYLGPELTRRMECELTPVGRLLRASQLDELPQLVNVLRGDMAVVGPRPIRPAFFEELCEQIPQYWQRLVVRPGMTGFAQLRITREMTWAEKLAHDLEYIADRSLGLYLRVVLATIARIASGLSRGLRNLGPARD